MKIFKTLLLLIVFILPLKVMAFIVYDPSVWAQAYVTAQNSYQQVTALQQQLNALKGLEPNQYQWSDTRELINKLGEIIQQNNTLAYNAQNLDQQFKQLYPGYAPPTNYTEQYKQITTTTLNTLNQVLHSMGANAQNFQSESSRLAFLQRQAATAKGQTQAIQAAAQIASEQVSQTQLLRQTLIAQSNAQTAYYAAQTQKEASAKAEMDKVINAGTTTAPSIGNSGNSIKVPSF